MQVPKMVGGQSWSSLPGAAYVERESSYSVVFLEDDLSTDNRDKFRDGSVEQ